MDPAIPLDEDCLYLNIWTPALRGSGADARLTGEPLPVMAVSYTHLTLPTILLV